MLISFLVPATLSGAAETDDEALVERVKQEGMRIGIRGTRGNILLHNESGKAIPMPGAIPIERMTPAVDRLLEESG